MHSKRSDTIKKLQQWKNNMRIKKHIAKLVVNDRDLRTHIIEYNKQRTYGYDTTICHLPMRSLYFGFGGIVTACCFNRKYKLGKCPENSIEEIIHGEKRKILQQHLDRIDFSLGCKLCQNIISTGNYMSVGARFGDIYPDQDDYPSEMTFELDNTCNLRCEMCNAKFSSAHDNGKCTVAPYDNKDFIIQLKKFIPYLSRTRFLGGEPLMSKIYPEIWNAIIELNPKCKIDIQTNGTILNDKIKSIMERGNFRIGISIDTLNPAHYEKIRYGAKIEQVLENLDFFNHISQKNGEYLGISVCPMKENRFDIPELVDFCNKKSICIYFNDVTTKGFALSELQEQELEELKAYYLKNNPNGINYISRYNHMVFSTLINEVEHMKYNHAQYEYMNEMITCTREEFREIVLSIISATPDIKYDESIWEYIPEKFSIKRNDYLYMKNKMEIWELKDFFAQPIENQIKYLKDFFHEQN